MARPRKNRGPREGTIFQRKDGRWQAALFDPVTQRRRFFYGRSYEAAHEKMIKAKADRHEGVPLAGRRLRVRAFLRTWLEARAAKVRPRTLESYRYLIERHIAHECRETCEPGCRLSVDGLGACVLASLQPSDVDRFLTRKLQAGLGPRTVGYALQLLRHALRDAAKQGLVGRNVAELVDGVVGSRTRGYVSPLSVEQTRKLLEQVRGARIEGFVTLAVHSGLRLGELLGLAWSDVDLEAGELRVRRTLQRNRKEGWSCGEPKSEHGKRVVPLTSGVVAALRAHRARQLEERLHAGSEWQDWGLVFPNVVGGPVHFKAALAEFQAALQAAGLPKKRVHDLRHGTATMLLASGVDLGTVARHLGHSDPAFTLRTYVSPDDAQRRSAAERLAAALAG